MSQANADISIGFPSSSHQFRELIPELATKYRVLAPGYPGFGFTEIPESRRYEFTTANIVYTTEAFLDALEVKSYAIYLHGFGAPVGMRSISPQFSVKYLNILRGVFICRMAINRTKSVTAFIIQNGNIYEEGWSTYWDPVRLWWSNADPNLRQSLKENLQPPHIKGLVNSYLSISRHCNSFIWHDSGRQDRKKVKLLVQRHTP